MEPLVDERDVVRERVLRLALRASTAALLEAERALLAHREAPFAGALSSRRGAVDGRPLPAPVGKPPPLPPPSPPPSTSTAKRPRLQDNTVDAQPRSRIALQPRALPVIAGWGAACAGVGDDEDLLGGTLGAEANVAGTGPLRILGIPRIHNARRRNMPWCVAEYITKFFNAFSDSLGCGEVFMPDGEGTEDCTTYELWTLDGSAKIAEVSTIIGKKGVCRGFGFIGLHVEVVPPLETIIEWFCDWAAEVPFALVTEEGKEFLNALTMTLGPP